MIKFVVAAYLITGAVVLLAQMFKKSFNRQNIERVTAKMTPRQRVIALIIALLAVILAWPFVDCRKGTS